MPVTTYTNPTTYAEIAEARWGRDLLNIDCQVGEVPATPTGDWPTIAGRENLHEAHRRRAITSPGELLHRPEYGGGLVLSVERSAAPHELAASANRLRANALRDRRLEDATCGVRLDDDGHVLVDLVIKPRGEPETDTVSIVSEV